MPILFAKNFKVISLIQKYVTRARHWFSAHVLKQFAILQEEEKKYKEPKLLAYISGRLTKISVKTGKESLAGAPPPARDLEYEILVENRQPLTHPRLGKVTYFGTDTSNCMVPSCTSFNTNNFFLQVKAHTTAQWILTNIVLNRCLRFAGWLHI